MSKVIAQFHKGKYVNKPIQLGTTLAKDVILEDGDSVDAKFRRLVCNSNGELSFKGKNLVRSVNGVNADAEGNVELYDYVIESVVNRDGSWYKKWKSGWLEQSGKFYSQGMTINQRINFLKPFLNNLYYLNCTHFTTSLWGGHEGSATLNSAADFAGLTSVHTTTGFNIARVDGPSCSFNWYACGMGA